LSIVSETVEKEALRVLDVREVTSGFGVLGLLFVEMSGEGDNVGVDLLVADSAALSISRHDCGYLRSLDVVKTGDEFP